MKYILFLSIFAFFMSCSLRKDIKEIRVKRVPYTNIGVWRTPVDSTYLVQQVIKRH